MRKVITFIMGMLFGIIFLFASLGIAGYMAYTMLHPSDVWSDGEKYLGDMSKMTVEEIVAELKKIVEKGADENGMYYSIADFETEYNVDFSSALGFSLSDDAKKIPVFSLFTQDGINKVLKQTPVSALTGFFDFLGDGAQAELSEHNLSELIAGDISGIFANVKIVELLPDMFSADKGASPLMVKLGECYLGGTYDALTKGNIFKAILPDGPMESLGQLKFTDILGDDNPLITGIVGDSQLADLFNGDGALVPEQILGNLHIGSVLGYVRVTRCYDKDGSLADCTVSDASHTHAEDYWASKNADGTLIEVTGLDALLAKIGYTDITSGDGIQGLLDKVMLGNLMYTLAEVPKTDEYVDLFTGGEADKVYKITKNGEESFIKKSENKYYDAKLKCGEADGAAHAHTTDCYGFKWFSTASDGTVSEATDILALLGDTSIGKLTAGGLDIMSIVGKLTLKDIVGNQPLDGIFAAFADKTISELISGGFSDVAIGTILGYTQFAVEESSLQAALGLPEGIHSLTIEGAEYLAKADKDGKFYTVYNCTDSHTHTADCYKFIWYKLDCNALPAHQTHAMSCFKEAEGVNKVLAPLTIKNLTDGSGFNEIISGIKIGDIIDTAGNALLEQLADFTIGELTKNIDSISLGSLLGLNRNKIDNLNAWESVVAKVYYKADASTPELYVKTQNAAVITSTDGAVWYEGKQICTDAEATHVHSAACYGFVWYVLSCSDSTHTSATHGFNKGCYELADGIKAVLAGLTVGDLTSGDGLDSLFGTLTINDIMPDLAASNGLFAELGNIPISQLGDKLYGIYLGSILEYFKQPSAIDAGALHPLVGNYYGDGGGKVYLKDGEIFYLAEISCKDASHTENAHTESCYRPLWYKLVCSDVSHGETHTPDCYKSAEGVIGKLAGLTLQNIIDGNIDSEIKSLTMADVLGMDAVPSMLKSLANVPIGELGSSITTLSLGDVMSYSRDTEPDISSYDVYSSGILCKNESGNTFYLKNKVGTDFWYKAGLICAETHFHSAKCFSYWYKENAGTKTFASGIENIIADKTIDELTGGNGFQGIIESLTLKDVLGDNIPSVLESLADTPISELTEAVNGLKIGNLGFMRDTVDDTSTYTFVTLSGGQQTVMSSGTDFIRLELGNWYKAELDCKDSLHSSVHEADCYRFFWHDASGLRPEGIFAALADLSITDFSDSSKLQKALNSLTLRDVLGDSIPDMLKAIADSKIGEIDKALKTLRIGDIMAYFKKPLSEYAGNAVEYVAGSGKLYVKTENGTIQLSENGTDYFEGKLLCKHTDDTHTADCFGYEYYKEQSYSNKVSGIEGSVANLTVGNLGNEALKNAVGNVTLKDVIDIGDSAPSILKKLKDKPVSELASAFDELTFGDAVEITSNSPAILRKLKDEKITDLSGAFDNMRLGDVMGNTLKQISQSEIAADYTIEIIAGKVYGTAAAGTANAKYLRALNGKYFQAALECTASHGLSHTEDCFAYIWYTDDNFSSEVSGIAKTFAGMSLSLDANAIQGAVKNLTLSEVLGADALGSGMLSKLADTKISQMSSVIDNLYIGDVMNLYRKRINDFSGYTDYASVTNTTTGVNYTVKINGVKLAMSENGADFYETEANCTDAGHSHGAECFAYVWYTDSACTAKAPAINGAIATITIRELGGSRIMDSVNELTLSDLGIAGTGSNVMNAIADTKIKNIGTAINDIKMGTVLGFEQIANVWYEKCNEAHDHSDEVQLSSGNYGKAASGINAKLVDKKMSDLNGGLLTDIVKSLTVGELIDSGMLTLSPDDFFKFDIIFCRDSSHAKEYYVMMTTKSYSCNYANFVILKNAGAVASAEQFFKDTHAGTSDFGATAERNAWYGAAFTDFITGLLQSI